MSTWGLLVVIVTLGFSAPAFAQKAEADAAFQRGRELMAKGAYAQACTEFETSMRFEPLHGTLYNLALCHEALGKLATAWIELKELAKNDTNAARAKDAARRAKALEGKLSYMHLVVRKQIDGLVVKRDALDVTPLVGQTVAIDPGRYTFVAEAPGYAPATVTATFSTPGASDVVIPELAADGSRVDRPDDDALDAYALVLPRRPLALPRRVIEISGASVLSDSKSYPTDPIDVIASVRVGFGVIEANVGAGLRLRYPTETFRADALTELVAGARYVITPRLLAGLEYLWHQPTGVGESRTEAVGSDLRALVSHKRILAPAVAVVAAGGVEFAERKLRGSAARQEFAFVGVGRVQLAALKRLSIQANTYMSVNMGGELYTHTLGLAVGASLVVAVDRHYDVFANGSFVVVPSSSDFKQFTVGMTRRIP